MNKIAIFIPGIMGSVLKLDEEIIWPGPLLSLKFAYKQMEKLLSPDLVATDCIRSFYLPQYISLLNDLEACGFSEKSGTLIVFPYDWRKDIASISILFAERLDIIVRDFGDNVEIYLIAHSMGGLVARLYLESNLYTNRVSWAKVIKLITLGTPHRGASVALPLVLGMEKKLFLSAAQVKEIANDSRYPSAYQLLPHKGECIAWQGITVTDIYDRTISHKLGLNIVNLKSAEDFQQSLQNGVKPAHVHYFCFSGNREITASYLKLLPRINDILYPEKIDQVDAGDGTVPIWSSTLAQCQFLYVAGEHGTIYKDNALRRVLGALLGKPETLASGRATEIVLSESVVEPRQQMHATLKLSYETTSFDGIIRITKLAQDNSLPQNNSTHEASYTDMEIKYDGPIIEFFSIAFVAPAMRGHYKAEYFERGVEGASASVELIVQQ